MSGQPKIYLFINGHAPEWYTGMALAEDGACLAQHASSSPLWSQHDMGFTSDWKHDAYDAHYPDGYELEWVDDVRAHPGVMEAYRLNQLAGAARDTKEATK